MDNFDNNIEETSRYRQTNVLFLVTVLFYMGMSMAFAGFIYRIGGVPLALLFSQAVLIVPSVLYLFLTGQNSWNGIRGPREALRLRPMNLVSVLLVILLAFLLMPLMSFINAASMMFTSNQVGTTMQGMMELPAWLSFLLMAVLPALCEETVYRGIFYNEYRKKSIRKGILLSGLLFGLLHLNLNQFCYAFVMGCLFALVVEITDSLLSSMIIHFVINGSSTAISYWQQETQAAEELEKVRFTLPEVLQVGAAAIVPTILAVLVLILLAKRAGRGQVWRQLFGAEEKTRLMTIPLLAGILICVGYIILVELAL